MLGGGRTYWFVCRVSMLHLCSSSRPRRHAAVLAEAVFEKSTNTSELVQEQDLVRLKREARHKGGFYVEPEAKLAFVIRIRGINDMHPKSRKILQLLRLRQIFNGVFIRVGGMLLGLPRYCCSSSLVMTCSADTAVLAQINKATLNMMRRVEPYIAWGYPNHKTVRELIYKRGFGKVCLCCARTVLCYQVCSGLPVYVVLHVPASTLCLLVCLCTTHLAVGGHCRCRACWEAEWPGAMAGCRSTRTASP